MAAHGKRLKLDVEDLVEPIVEHASHRLADWLVELLKLHPELLDGGKSTPAYITLTFEREDVEARPLPYAS